MDAGAGAGDGPLNTHQRRTCHRYNRWLPTDLLRQQWGFKGLTISDHGAVKELIANCLPATSGTPRAWRIQAGVEA